MKTIHLLNVEPELATAMAPEERARATAEIRVPLMELPTGVWQPSPQLGQAFALLVVAGLVLDDGADFEIAHPAVLGPGDLIDGRRVARPPGSWNVLVAAQVAVLGERLIAGDSPWPQLPVGLARRLFDAQYIQGQISAIRGLPRVEDRIVQYLLLQAERWGRVTAAGTVVALPVTHETLGRLVGARRPTVTLALRDLRRTGRLEVLDDGRWLLRTPRIDHEELDERSLLAAVNGR